MTSVEAFANLSAGLSTIYDKQEAENISDWVLENITGKKRWERRLDKISLSIDELNLYDKYKRDLLTYKPVQYVLNEAFFCGFKFILNENVLIPRPETEELVHFIAEENKHIKNIRILDIGTGSGCIPVSLKKLLPQAIVDSLDISPEAIATAIENAHNLGADISLMVSDFLNEGNWQPLSQYSLIVSNPPYIPLTEKSSLDKNVVDFEPNVALFVPENDPLLFYRKIEKFAGEHLLPEGKIYFEVHETYAQEVLNLFANQNWKGRIQKDMYGKKRMVIIERQ